MAPPSRLMPAFTPEPQPTWGRTVAMILALVIFSFVAWLVWMRPLPVLGAVVTMLLVTILVEWQQRKRLRAIAASRPGDPLCTYARALPIRELDTWVVRAVFDGLQAYLPTERSSFPIRPSDRLVKDLHVDVEDLDDILAPEIAQRTGRSFSDTVKNPYYGKVVTVEDLIRFFCAQPKKDGAAEQGVEADEAR